MISVCQGCSRDGARKLHVERPSVYTLVRLNLVFFFLVEATACEWPVRVLSTLRVRDELRTDACNDSPKTYPPRDY